MSLSHLVLLYAASLLVAYFVWHGCGQINNAPMRGMLRAALVALLCTPGIAVGHGIMPVPSLFGLFVQPLFTLLPVAIGCLFALIITFTGNGKRNPATGWPSLSLLLRYSPAKLVLFGVITALTFVSVQQA